MPPSSSSVRFGVVRRALSSAFSCRIAFAHSGSASGADFTRSATLSAMVSAALSSSSTTSGSSGLPPMIGQMMEPSRRTPSGVMTRPM